MDLTRMSRNISTAAVTMIAAWSSWSHMVHVALRFGERPEVAYVLPISVDGMLVVASTAMVEDKRAGRSVRWSARIAFAAGVVASVAANIAAAHPTLGARTVAAWPALAMLLVVEILSRGRPPSPKGETVGRVGEMSAKRDGQAEPARASGTTAAVRGAQSAIGASTASGPARRKAMGHQRRPGGPTAEEVRRLRADNPDAGLAEIARRVGVSERHVRRVLNSESDRLRAATAVVVGTAQHESGA